MIWWMILEGPNVDVCESGKTGYFVLWCFWSRRNPEIKKCFMKSNDWTGVSLCFLVLVLLGATGLGTFNNTSREGSWSCPKVLGASVSDFPTKLYPKNIFSSPCTTYTHTTFSAHPVQFIPITTFTYHFVQSE